MSDKKRLQNLVWDGLFNGLDPKATDGAKAEKKNKKAAKEKENKGKPDEDEVKD